MPVIEISLDSVASALAAEAGGAQRIELCSALREGGLTPSLGLIRTVRARTRVELHVIVRPRSGDFLYSDEEFDAMREDIAVAAEAGVRGVVLGILTAEGKVDVERTRELVAFARPMEVTFHRALDMARDLEEALEDVIGCGVDRVLTSGGQPDALRGCTELARLVRRARGRVAVMAGGGVRPANIAELMETTGATEFHSSLRRVVPSPMQHIRSGVHLSEPGFDEYARTTVLAEEVRDLVQAAQGAAPLHRRT